MLGVEYTVGVFNMVFELVPEMPEIRRRQECLTAADHFGLSSAVNEISSRSTDQQQRLGSFSMYYNKEFRKKESH